MLTLPKTSDMPLLMPVHSWVRAKGRCPYCHGIYNHDNGFKCCHTVPERYYVYLPAQYSNTDKAEYFYSTLLGDPLDSLIQANNLASALEVEVENSSMKKVDVTRFSHQRVKPLLFPVFCKTWLGTKSDLSPQYKRVLERSLERYFLRFQPFRRIDVRRIDSRMIEDFKQWLDEQSIREKLKPSSKATILTYLMNIIGLAASYYGFKAPEIPKIRIPKESKNIITTEQQNLYLKKIECINDYRIFHFMFGTGVRGGEACALRWPNVELQKGMVNICENFSAGIHRPITKGLRPRMIGLDLRYPLTQMLSEMYDSTLDREGFVFRTHTGKLYTVENLSNIWYAIRSNKKMKLTEAVRSSYIVWHIETYNDLRWTQKIAGHRDIATTQRYLDDYNEEKRYLELVKKGK